MEKSTEIMVDVWGTENQRDYQELRDGEEVFVWE